MNVPGSICCPNGELVYRVPTLVLDPHTPIIIHCAGRTRGIIGAQTLRDFGIANPVYALENGTMGWCLAGLQLEHGSTRTASALPSAVDLDALAECARDFAGRQSVPSISPKELQSWLVEPKRTTYLLDVRTRVEFEQEQISGAVHAHGGQLIQATDQWLATRNARVVLIDDREIRAVFTTNWLRRLGWDAYVLAGGAPAWVDACKTWSGLRPTDTAPAILPQLLPSALLEHADAELLDVRSSAAFQAWHVRGARWANRSDGLRETA